MGCVSSKTDINDRHPNIFQVTNVNEQGVPISPGKLQVTETELVLYQRGKEPTRWPLRSLRKYGFDIEVFSFECGRRCPTGQGIYAFRCRKAEQLFNIVQQHITGNTNEETNPLGTSTNTNPNNIEFPIPTVSTGPPVQRRIVGQNQPDGYLNPISGPTTRPTLSRPGSVTSNGPISPIATSPPPVNNADLPPEHNNNKRASLVPEHAYTNTSVLADNVVASYINLGVPPQASVPSEGYMNITQGSGHVYMNVDTNDPSANFPNNPNAKESIEITEMGEVPEETHCYANIDSKDIENLRPLLMANNDVFPSVPQTPTVPFGDVDYTASDYITVREVNYAELDLDPGKKIVEANASAQEPPESPVVPKKSYATIDFQKTNALCKSIIPRMEEEGSRKTRHNSTINYNNSLSD